MDRVGGTVAHLKRWALVVLGAWWAAAAVGCTPKPEDVLRDEAGNEIRLGAITAITGDETLTDGEKRQMLRDLGITDESLIEALVTGTAATQ
jgi:hypothetical protein